MYILLIVLIVILALVVICILFGFKAFSEWLVRYKENNRQRIEIEKDGWFEFNETSLDWKSRSSMKKWKKSIKMKLEVCDWIQENTTSGFNITKIGDKEYIRFGDV